MTPGQRSFLEKYVAQWSRRSKDRRATGVPTDARIADALDRIVGEMVSELASAPPEHPPMSVSEDPDKITWKSPVFHVGGRFNPFAGTIREGWLASADACERLGYPDIGEAYRQMAANVDPAAYPEAVQVTRSPSPMPSPSRSAPRRRSTWKACRCRRPNPFRSPPASRSASRCDHHRIFHAKGRVA